MRGAIGLGGEAGTASDRRASRQVPRLRPSAFELEDADRQSLTPSRPTALCRSLIQHFLVMCVMVPRGK